MTVPSISMCARIAVRGFVLISGEWLDNGEGIVLPIVRARIVGASGQSSHAEAFLIDSGAELTVFREALVNRLRLSIVPSPPGLSLTGVGGRSDFVTLDATLEFDRDDGLAARVHGPYSAFTDPKAIDLSLLGRDVLHNFDLILSRQRNEVLLLAPNHRYQVVRA